ncbi:MAG TPA: pyridoxine 5'-phosphate synthase, partial [Acetobacteraceae bacterium]
HPPQPGRSSGRRHLGLPHALVSPSGGGGAAVLDACAATAEAAHDAGLVVNAGHDLNLRNIPPLIARIGFLAEASIGHELTADALMMGFPKAVAAYAAALRGAGA